MKTQIIQDDPEPARTGSPPARTPPPGSGGRVALTLFGGVAAVLALALLISGAIAVVALGQRDDDGYFTTDAHRLSTPSAALVSERLDIETGDAPAWVFGSDFATSRIQASSARPVFVGIGPAADVERYLDDIRHTQITDVDTDPFRVTSHLVPGSAQAAPPAAQSFWRVQASGTGTRTVTWPVESGQWSVVMMNADGSPGVDVSTRLGARISSLTGVAIGLLAGGVVFGLAAALMLRAGTRRPARA
jgi:hypothetical protein